MVADVGPAHALININGDPELAFLIPLATVSKIVARGASMLDLIVKCLEQRDSQQVMLRIPGSQFTTDNVFIVPLDLSNLNE
jgi:hypothetical protein